MKKLILHLLLVVSIAVSPLGQATTLDAPEQMSMPTTMDDCIDCAQHLGLDQGGCMDGDCFSGICLNASSGSVFFFQENAASAALRSLSISITSAHQARYLSRTPSPLYRPPIA